MLNELKWNPMKMTASSIVRVLAPVMIISTVQTTSQGMNHSVKHRHRNMVINRSPLQLTCAWGKIMNATLPSNPVMLTATLGGTEVPS